MSATPVFVALLVAVLNCMSSATVVFLGQTTACETCDNIEYNSVRNIVCCAKFSKCCIPDTIDGYEREARRQRGLTSGLIPNWSNVAPVVPLSSPVLTTKKPRRKSGANNKNKKQQSGSNRSKSYAKIDEKAFVDQFERAVATALQREHPGSKIKFL